MRLPLPAPFRFALLSLPWTACGDGPTQSPVALPAVEITELTAQRVAEDLSSANPDAPYWSKVAPGRVKLLAQPMITPRPETTTTEEILVQSVHDGHSIAFRLSWPDTELSAAGRLGEYSDACALEFPMSGEDPPSPMMGSKDHPVHIFHWRAQYQRDKEKGKPEIHELYPNVSIDMYPMDFKDAASGSADDKQAFNPGMAVGNPQSYSKTGLDEIIAEGYSTSTVTEGHGGGARGSWKNGMWSVVVTRPLAIEGGSVITVGGKNMLAYAVWQGGQGEVGSRKSLLMSWMPLKVM